MLEHSLNNNEAEANLIGLLLIDSDNVSKVVNEIKSDDFFDRRHNIIYSTIVSLHRDSKPIDIVTVSELIKFNKMLECVGGRTYINDLALNATGNIKQLVKIIIKYSKKRKLINICNDVIAQINNQDVDELALNLEKESSKILNRTSVTSLQPIGNGIVEALEYFEKLSENEKKLLGLDTSFDEFNFLLSGLCPSRFYVLGARPSVGKSALAQQIGEYIAKDKVVLYISLEMSTSEFTQRSIYRLSGYNQDHLARGIIPQDTIFEAFNKAAADLQQLKLYVVDDSKCTLSTIKKNIEECKVKFGSCDLVIIDYLQLMESDDKYETDDYNIVTKNSRGLKKLAREYKIPILALAQLSREVEKRKDKKPTLSDLRDSGGIEQDADAVMFLYRPEMYFSDVRYRGRAYLLIEKNRQGKRGTVELCFNGTKTEFKEVVNGQ